MTRTPPGPPRPHTSRRFRVLGRPAVATLLAAGSLFAPVVVSPPAGAVGLGWNVTIDVPPPATGPSVTVSGRASVLLGEARSVHVRLVPRADLPEACGPVEGTGGVAGGRYTVEVRPACNGPYRAEVVASGVNLLGGRVSSGSPAGRDLALADPGPAPPAPGAVAGRDGVTLTWPPADDPDIVGWTVLPEGGLPRELAADTTQVVVPVGIGDHGFRLQARRWGAEGPGGPPVPSPPSAVTTVRVEAESSPLPDRPGSPSGPDGPGSGPGSPTGGGGGGDGPTAGAGGGGPAGTAGGSAGSDAPRRGRIALPRGGETGTAPGSTSRPSPATAGDPGYRGELPYGSRPGTTPVPEAEADPEPAGEQVAAGAPSARVVRTTERTSPGLVVPFTFAFVLFSAGIWSWTYLRRTRLARMAVAD